MAEISVLLVEDNSDDAILLQARLATVRGRTVAVQHVQTLQHAINALAASRFDAVLLDLSLPDSRGTQTLERVLLASPGTAVVVLTGASDEQIASEAIRLGAQSYFMKDEANPNMLVRAISFASERARVERHLQSAEAVLAELLMRTVDLFVVVDADGVVQYVNPAAEKLTGTPVHAFIGRPFALAYSLDMRTETKLRVLSSKSIPVEVQAFSALWNGEQVTVLSIRDITERVSLERERALLASTVVHAADAISVLDADGTIEYVNPAFTSVLGYPKEDVLGTKEALLEPVGLFAGVNAGIRNKLDKSDSWRGRVNLNHADGRSLTVDVTVSVVRDMHGTAINYVVMKRDLTRQMMLDARVQKSQKLESLGQLASGVAHDFNNFLSAIIGYTEMAQRAVEATPTVYEDLTRALKGAYQARDLVAQILSYSRQGAEQRMPVNLGNVVEDTMNLIRPTLPHNIDVQVEIDGDAGIVTGSSNQLLQVFMNMCVNAIHAMRPDGGLLRVSVENFDVDKVYALNSSDLPLGRFVRVAISDSGCGISQEVQANLFEAYVTTKPEGQGTGLGLYTSKEIVESHGGRVTVYSEPGRGTTFKIYLPMADSSTLSDPLLVGDVPLGDGQLVLLVDDENGILQIEKAMLEYLGYRVSAYDDPRDAIETFSSAPNDFAIVVTDIVMPHMSGDEFVGRIRSIRTSMPIIVTTGHKLSGRREHGQYPAGVMLLTKPVMTATFAREIQRLISVPSE